MTDKFYDEGLTVACDAVGDGLCALDESIVFIKLTHNLSPENRCVASDLSTLG